MYYIDNNDTIVFVKNIAGRGWISYDIGVLPEAPFNSTSVAANVTSLSPRAHPNSRQLSVSINQIQNPSEIYLFYQNTNGTLSGLYSFGSGDAGLIDWIDAGSKFRNAVGGPNTYIPFASWYQDSGGKAEIQFFRADIRLPTDGYRTFATFSPVNQTQPNGNWRMDNRG